MKSSRFAGTMPASATIWLEACVARKFYIFESVSFVLVAASSKIFSFLTWLSSKPVGFWSIKSTIFAGGVCTGSF